LLRHGREHSDCKTRDDQNEQRRCNCGNEKRNADSSDLQKNEPATVKTVAKRGEQQHAYGEPIWVAVGMAPIHAAW
jgi:hypothetical protein